MQLDATNRLRLQGREETLIICTAAWRHLVETASDRGWRSVHPPACYWGDIGLEVTATDAHRLARALEAIGDDLVNNADRFAGEDVSQLVADLGDLLIFCRAGAFRVC